MSQNQTTLRFLDDNDVDDVNIDIPTWLVPDERSKKQLTLFFIPSTTSELLEENVLKCIFPSFLLFQ